MRLILLFVAVAAVLVEVSIGVDRNNFKTCDQSSFCRYFFLLSRSQMLYI